MSGSAVDDKLEPLVAPLLKQVGLDGDFVLEPLPGAGNNRVVRVRLAKTSVLLKSYFRHPSDKRDRLGAEFSFLTLAWDQGVQLVPQPLASDAIHGLGLYEFIEGRRLLPGEIDAARVQEAAALFTSLNASRDTAAARRLPDASEACFSIAEHLASVEARLRRLADMPVREAVDAAAAEFVRARLHPAWSMVMGRVPGRAAHSGWELDAPVARANQRLSPSDFGFHNALLTPSGQLRFVDFEYGGWDDPAKTVCDFYCHPALPVPPSTFEHFAGAVLAGLEPTLAWRGRVGMLMPVHRIKWCCIMLNEFLPMDSERRKYSNAGADPSARKRAQLEKAERFLRREVLDRDAAGALFSVG